MSVYESWGRYPKVEQEILFQEWTDDSFPRVTKKVLPRGMGRSYGDSCLNNGATLLSSRYLNRIRHFDPQSGLIRVESGISLDEILSFAVPRGWFLPVVPGTKFVSVGGAIANDIHGKNHHKAGTFGCFVKRLELLRSDQTRYVCSLEENREWFSATIGGLGLTGFITWVELELKPIKSAYIDQETVKFNGLDDFFDLSRESSEKFEYTVAWIDCLAQGDGLGRGHFIRGNHSSIPTPKKDFPLSKKAVPFDFPNWALNSLSIKLFNELYYNRQFSRIKKATVHFNPFFFPLDAISDWNRIYGARGFLQWQCVIPLENGKELMREILRRISKAQAGSFLAVLKIFGSKVSPGLLSFPAEGVTLTLDFPIDEPLFALLNSLDEIVLAAKGRLYPAKDSRMTAKSFDQFYPQWSAFEKFRDPNISSSFIRRVGKI